MRVSVGQPHGGRPVGSDMHQRGGQIGPVPQHRRRRRREPGRLEGRFAVKVVHGADPAQCLHLPGQGSLLVLVEVGGHPGVEDDQRSPFRDRRRHGREVCHHVAALESRRVRRGAHVGQRGAQAAETHRIVGPLARKQPEGCVVGEGIDRCQIEAHPVCHRRKPDLGEERQVVASRAFESHRRARRARGQHVVPDSGPVRVRVVVEEQVESRRSAEVEQGERLLPPGKRGDMAQSGQEAGAAPHLVGLGRAGGDQLHQFGAMGLAEVREVGRDVGGRCGIDGSVPHRGHRVVVRRQRVLHAREQQEVHRSQQEEGPTLG